MRIVNFGQVVDLEHGGGFAHQFTVALDSGERLSIITDEETVQQLIEITMMMAPEEKPSHLRVVDSPDPANVMTQRMRQAMEEAGESDVMVAPGVEVMEHDPGELAAYEPPGEVPESQPVMGKVADVPIRGVPRGVQPGGLGQPSPPVKRRPNIDADGFMITPPPRTVPTDEMGYPITAASRQEPDPEPEDEDVGEQI
jgi:hypothetical protein